MRTLSAIVRTMKVTKEQAVTVRMSAQMKAAIARVAGSEDSESKICRLAVKEYLAARGIMVDIPERPAGKKLSSLRYRLTRAQLNEGDP